MNHRRRVIITVKQLGMLVRMGQVPADTLASWVTSSQPIKVPAGWQTSEDFRRATAEEVVRTLMARIREANLAVSDVYGGLTNDIRANLRRHRISRYVACFRVKNSAVATAVEGLLSSEGVDIGVRGAASAGNGIDPETSNIVYIADKTLPGFRR